MRREEKRREEKRREEKRREEKRRFGTLPTSQAKILKDSTSEY
jgi:hypothetical protein